MANKQAFLHAKMGDASSNRFETYSEEKEKDLSEKQYRNNTNYSTNFAVRDDNFSLTNVGDVTDTDLMNLTGDGNNMRVGDENNMRVGGALNFAPVLTSCSNITFNVYVNKNN